MYLKTWINKNWYYNRYNEDKLQNQCHIQGTKREKFVVHRQEQEIYYKEKFVFKREKTSNLGMSSCTMYPQWYLVKNSWSYFYTHTLSFARRHRVTSISHFQLLEALQTFNTSKYFELLLAYVSSLGVYYYSRSREIKEGHWSNFSML